MKAQLKAMAISTKVTRSDFTATQVGIAQKLSRR